MWLITKNQWHLSHREVPPFPLFPHAVHPPASLPANSAPQPSISQAGDGDDHVVFASFDFGHAVGFQAQLFSDKRCNEHLGSFPFSGLCGNNPERIQDSRCLSVSLFNSWDSHSLNSNYTFRIRTVFASSTASTARPPEAMHYPSMLRIICYRRSGIGPFPANQGFLSEPA
jgi:hypothetical protein